MGLDGLSMGNLGLHKEITSAQMSNQAEQLANKDLGFKIKDVVEIAKEKGIQVKEDGSNQNANYFEQDLNQNENAEDNNFEKTFDEKVFEKTDPKEFSVRVNPETEMIELFNNKHKKTMETISAKDLMQLISKLDSASGIIVNRKI